MHALLMNTLLICRIQGLFLHLSLFMINESLYVHYELLLSIGSQINSTGNV